MKSTIPISIAALAIAGGFALLDASAAERWYTDAQVEAGEAVYRDNCMTCHNERGAGTENWQQRDAEGKLPPPPLNGTAHTWHHDLGILARTIVDGGARLGGTMPSFTDALGANDIAAVIAYVQSLWPEEIYTNWAKAYPQDAARGVPVSAEAVAVAPQPPASGSGPANGITERLSSMLSPGTAIGEPEKTPIDGIYGVMAGSRYLYLDETGRFIFTGELMDLAARRNLTEEKLSAMRSERLAGFADTDKVIFEADGGEIAHLDIFTDTTCPYCRKLHSEVPQLQKAGITVRYLPFPRSGKRGGGYEQMRSVWCAEDRNSAMTAAKTDAGYEIGDTGCADADAVDAGYRLGVEVGVSGTPAIVLPDGSMIPGYRPWQQLAEALGVKTR